MQTIDGINSSSVRAFCALKSVKSQTIYIFSKYNAAPL